MLARDHKSRFGQLLATLIYNAGTRPQSAEPHPIALVGTTLGGALIRCLRSAYRPPTAILPAAIAAIRVTAVVSATEAK